ncbi:MAG: cardiolipin synthase [Duncaniella sp.]|nr:cardiolipin synthase [Duncaniella sp.]MDE6823258.1 cardiolipin synthase [Duncaniella sp.]MDE7475474.1 cardiolipin synthase [Duncaniella sp.]
MHELFISITWNGLWWSLTVGYAVLILCVIAIVISENRNPLKALGWVTALLLFPVGGIILYFVFGRSIRNVRMISRRNRRKLLRHEGTQPLPKLDRRLSVENRQRIRLAYSIGGANLYTGNDVRIFDEGESHFEALFEDLRKAREYINLQFYIIACDSLGRRLRDILIERARAGVKVRVIYDYIGSFDARRRDFFQRMKENGVEVHSFFRLSFPSHVNRLNWRNHRKVVVIDGNVGYIGGMNVAERYVTGGGFGKWRDSVARISGPCVAALQYHFAVDWKFMGHDLLCDPVGGEVRGIGGDVSNVTLQVLASGPNDRWGNMLLLFYKAISTARRRVWLQTPYFLPSEALMKALESAALAGVDVRVMMPRRSDSRILTYASHSYVEECLVAGIKVYFYDAGMLHAKVLIVDDDFSTLGSTNFDFRSLEHNFEENLLMYSPETNAILARSFEDDAKESTRLKISDWNRRERKRKIQESVYRLLSPIL